MAIRKSSSAAPKRLQGLWYHPTGGYAKKFRGRTHYLWKDPEIAAQRFKNEWPYIQAGEVGFYSLRRTFRIYADECDDDRAAGLIMGHTDTSMAGRCVQKISDERLVAVVEHVRNRVLSGVIGVDQPEK